MHYTYLMMHSSLSKSAIYIVIYFMLIFSFSDAVWREFGAWVHNKSLRDNFVQMIIYPTFKPAFWSMHFQKLTFYS